VRKEVKSMNLLDKKGKTLGLILAGNIPAARFIVIKEHAEYYEVVTLIKVDDKTGELAAGVNPFGHSDEFDSVIPLPEFQQDNPDGWEKFKAAYAEIAAKMEAEAGAPPVS
jgi:hypothetical protein